MNKLLTTTLVLGTVLVLGANQSVQANCGGCAGYAVAPAPYYGYATTCSPCWDPYYNNYATNYVGRGLFSQIVNSLL
ncbi:MAG: hypothetical protein HYX35_02480 [Proteobacteria bacterium]|nr:hypothetical protein [Pseudomonadota bacterium]